MLAPTVDLLLFGFTSSSRLAHVPRDDFLDRGGLCGGGNKKI